MIYLYHSWLHHQERELSSLKQMFNRLAVYLQLEGGVKDNFGIITCNYSIFKSLKHLT